MASDTSEAIAALEMTDSELERIARVARERTLEEHTSTARARQLENLLTAAIRPVAVEADVGIVPAAGAGSRIQPLAFSKELLPVGSRLDGDTERPRAVSEYLVERMVRGGARRICFVISPGKSDILEYYGGSAFSADICYAVQPKPAGLCDAIFRALPMIRDDEQVLVGLPDTVWFPEDGFSALEDGRLSFLLFPVDRPERFDAVITDRENNVIEIQVKRRDASSNWVWGAFKMPGGTLRALDSLWRERECRDEYLGTLVNAWLELGGAVKGVRAGEAYVDVGTLNGYREALRLLADRSRAEAMWGISDGGFAANGVRGSGWRVEHVGRMARAGVFHSPREGAREFLSALHAAGFRVVVLTVRWHEWVSEWLERYGLLEFVEEVTDRKPPAHAYVDDRAICFGGSFPETLQRVIDFRPFWEKGASAYRVPSPGTGSGHRQRHPVLHDRRPVTDLLIRFGELEVAIADREGRMSPHSGARRSTWEGYSFLRAPRRRSDSGPHCRR